MKDCDSKISSPAIPKEGKITAIRLGRRVLIEPSELERLVEEGRGGKSN